MATETPAPAQMGHPTEEILRDRLYIGGEWVEPAGTGTIEVGDSTTERVIGRIPEGTPEDVDRAAEAARAGFEAWREVPVSSRVEACTAISAALAERADEIAALIAAEVGMPLRLARTIQAGLPAMDFGSMAQVAGELAWEEQIGNSLIVREPVGVVGCITPWNYPLHQLCAKVAPALTAGCSVVAKPSEVTPLTSFILAEIVDSLDLPAGAFNLVTGLGPVVGEAIAAHQGVDMVSFTGSTRAGRRVAEVAAQTVKKVALELGGKSANVILDDADLKAAIGFGVANCYLNSGQTCSAHTRMLVPREKLAEAEELAAAAAEKAKPGDPFDEGTRLGPLVSEAQRERVREYIRKGQEEGAKLVAGGVEPPEDVESGYFVRPTVFSEVKPEMTIAQEEIFGPVLSIMPYESEDEAAEIANSTIYGLDGGVWSSDPERAKQFARRMRTGQVQINGATFNPIAPFGGFKQSGHGREYGRYGLEEFLEVKSIQL
ncbi:MAG TPA: aldehyde dehydrogenase family protein [Solirubrobacterales bacterium]|nr:aldehyde dehydrogenase family protein [Solirubrobacterales bacterium]